MCEMVERLSVILELFQIFVRKFPDSSEMILFWAVGIVFAQQPGCDYERCIDTRFGPFKTQISCGVVVSEDPVNGIIYSKALKIYSLNMTFYKFDLIRSKMCAYHNCTWPCSRNASIM